MTPVSGVDDNFINKPRLVQDETFGRTKTKHCCGDRKKWYGEYHGRPKKWSGARRTCRTGDDGLDFSEILAVSGPEADCRYLPKYYGGLHDTPLDNPYCSYSHFLHCRYCCFVGSRLRLSVCGIVRDLNVRWQTLYQTDCHSCLSFYARQRMAQLPYSSCTTYSVSLILSSMTFM